MAWIEVHQSLRDHRKILMLADELDMPEPHAAGHCLYLWLWSLDNATDGVLPTSRRIIARAAGWIGDPDLFVDALITAGMLDIRTEDGALHIHDWDDYAGKIADRRERNKQAMREARAREKADRVQHVGNTSTSRDETSKATVPNHTVPNSTVSNKATISSSGNISNKPREYASAAHAAPRSPSPKAKTQKPEPIPRPRNELWDAVVQAIGYEPKTRSECSNWGKVLQELKDAGATPEDVPIRCARYVRRWGKQYLTINALKTHWSELAVDVPVKTTQNGAADDGETRQALAAELAAKAKARTLDEQRRYEQALQIANAQTPVAWNGAGGKTGS